MEPAYGDIVTITARADGVNWIMSPSGSPSPDGTPNVRLLRNGDGVWLSHTVRVTEVRLIERPVFAIGEKITVGHRTGTILKIDGGTARIAFDPQHHPLKGGGFLKDYGTEGDTEIWRLAIDNKLPKGRHP